MSDAPVAEPRSEARHTSPSRARGSWLTLVAMALAVVAIGLSGLALLKPVLTGSDSVTQENYSDAQRADAKSKTCLAFDTVRRGVTRNTSVEVPGGPDDFGGTLAAAANARISLYVGGQYLLARVQPATATDLAGAVRGFANNLMDIGAAATAGAQNGDPEQAARLRTADADNTKIAQMCA